MPMYSTSRYCVFEGVAPDPTPGVDPWAGLAEYDFVDSATGVDGTTRLIWVKLWDHKMYLRLSYDGVNYGDDILFDEEHPPVPLWFSAQKMQVRNETGGNTAQYSIEGYW